MSYLLDTCTLRELRHPQGISKVKEFVYQWPDEMLFVSVITAGEVARGVALLPDGPKRRELGDWLNGLRNLFRDRILLVDWEIGQVWGELYSGPQNSDQAIR